MTFPAIEVVAGHESLNRVMDSLNVIDALWVVVSHKCLAALLVQRTKGAAEGRLSQNTTWQDPNPQQDRSGDLQRVC